MAYHVELSPAAQRDLRKLESAVRNRILAAFVKLEGDPHPVGSKKLQDRRELWRIRVGDYRVVYEIQNNVLVVLVVRIAHRRNAYR